VQLTGAYTSDTGVIDHMMAGAIEKKAACNNALSTMKFLKDDPLVRKTVRFFMSSEKFADDSTMEKVQGETILAFDTQTAF
jgi:hypothetical protein